MSDALIARLHERVPEAIVEASEFRGETSVVVRKEHLIPVMTFLRDDPELRFAMLADLCGVDRLCCGGVGAASAEEPRFEVVYHLLSLEHRRRLRIKTHTASDDLHLPSVTGVWPGANWYEREIYDMFGVTFDDHPDLRRILMPEEWEGHPLCKDYPLGYEEVAFTYNQDEIYRHKPFAKE
jgi:NADH-quinone oxidoreductase subunit C